MAKKYNKRTKRNRINKRTKLNRINKRRGSNKRRCNNKRRGSNKRLKKRTYIKRNTRRNKRALTKKYVGGDSLTGEQLEKIPAGCEVRLCIGREKGCNNFYFDTLWQQRTYKGDIKTGWYKSTGGKANKTWTEWWKNRPHSGSIDPLEYEYERNRRPERPGRMAKIDLTRPRGVLPPTPMHGTDRNICETLEGIQKKHKAEKSDYIIIENACMCGGGRCLSKYIELTE